MEIVTDAKLLSVDLEDFKDVRLTVVYEDNGKISLSCDGIVLLVSAASLREVLNG